jgi:hypothetical protein
MTYLGDKVVGNFRPTRTARQKAKASKSSEKRAERPGNSEEHLAAIRKCPCCVPSCNRVGGVDPHHIKSAGERGAGLRASDRWAVPLCRPHHDEIERLGSRNEATWFRQHGIEVIDLAASLWGSRADAATMTKIILAFKVVR